MKNSNSWFKTYPIILLFLLGNLCSQAQTVIKLKKVGRVFTTSCLVNGLKLELYLDTGADEVTISALEALFMLKNGYLDPEDFHDTKKYETASGDIVEGTEVLLKRLEIGGVVLTNVKASVLHSLKSPLLMGQSALARLGKITIDYEAGTLTFNEVPAHSTNNTVTVVADDRKRSTSQNNNVGTKMEMVHIKGSKFMMGSSNGKNEEMPQHEVSVKSFYMGKYEVTYAQFKAFCDATGYRTTAEVDGTAVFIHLSNREIKRGLNWRYTAEGDLNNGTQPDLPVSFTSWYDAEAYCKWLSKATAKHYRLPTEAEWEFAAKGGLQSKGTTYAGSNNIDEVGWTRSNSNDKMHPVGQLKPNELSLYDMTGNMIEYCNDWFDPQFYGHSPSNNPTGPSDGIAKVARGGGVFSYPVDSRNVDRHWDEPASRCNYNGFRVVMEE